MMILFVEQDVAVFYKITTEAEWAVAVAKGVFAGAALDLKDGYIHLSTSDQARETARLHFGGQESLVLVAVPENAVAVALKWEASRGGQMFPHVYATLDPASALWVKPLPWNGAGHDFPKEFEA
jgi:uncharacterized protein (DUF952 family)